MNTADSTEHRDILHLYLFKHCSYTNWLKDSLLDLNKIMLHVFTIFLSRSKFSENGVMINLYILSENPWGKGLIFISLWLYISLLDLTAFWVSQSYTQ
jgi:hypothetical protein